MIVERRGQSGAALVTAMLVVALATIVATAMAHRMQLDIQRQGNLQSAERSYQYAMGLELWALAALRLDAQETPNLDSRLELWASSLPIIDLPEGRLAGQMEDLDGRFNINNLFVAGVRQSRQIERFQRLLMQLEVNPQLAEVLVDWMDPDGTAEPGGAEDGEYMRRQPAYRAANRQVSHISELRALSGMDEDSYQRLLPHVAALPVDQTPTLVNVNSATLEVLKCLDPAITQSVAERIHQDGAANFQSFDELQRTLSPINLLYLRDTIGLDSRYFSAHGMVEVDGRLQHYFSLIEQGQRGFQVIHRRSGVY